MRKVALLVLVAVLSLGFVGCKTETTHNPPYRTMDELIPPKISALVSYVEYVPMEAPKAGENPTGLTHTTVVFNWNGFRSDPVQLMGDQSAHLTVGMVCSNLELVSWSQDDVKRVQTYRFTYERMGYLVSFTVVF